MTERVFFNKLVTKSLSAVDSEQRFFEGYLTVEMVDKQNEITIVDELMKVLPVWMSRGGPISDTHSNRIVGKGINYHKTSVVENGVEYPAIYIKGMIYKGMGYELDDEIWEKIKNGTYKGLSFGGATKSDRVPVTNKDGTTSYALKDLEHYEVAVCEEPAVPLALITQFNPVAKAIVDKSKGKYIQKDADSWCIRCTSFGCYVDKTFGADPARASEKAPGQVEPFSEKTSVEGSIDIPVSEKAFQDTKIVDDSPQAEGLKDTVKDGEWSDNQGVNRPMKDDQKVERAKGKPEKPSSGKQNDPTGEDFEAVAHEAGQGGSGIGQDGIDLSNYGVGKTENEAFKPNEELLGAAGKSKLKHPEAVLDSVEPEEKTLNPGENMNMEKPIRGLRGTGGEVGNRGGHSMMAGAKANAELEKSFTDLKKEKLCDVEYLKGVHKILAKYDYDMRGIINDPQTNDPRKDIDEPGKDKGMPPSIQANNSEDGVKGKIRTNLDETAQAFNDTDEKKKVGQEQALFPGGGTRGGAYETTDQSPQQWDMRRTETGSHTRDTKRVTSGDKDSLNTINTAMKKMETAQKVAIIRRSVTNL